MIVWVGSMGSFSFSKEHTGLVNSPSEDGLIALTRSRSADNETCGEPTSIVRQTDGSTIQDGNSRDILSSAESTWMTGTPPATNSRSPLAGEHASPLARGEG